MTSNTTTLPAPSRQWHLVTGLILLAWFGLILGLSLNGTFMPAAGEPPRLLLFTGLVSLGLFALAWRSLPALRSYLLSLDLRLLILLHGTRTLGLGFIMLYMVDELPMLFAMLAGFGDAIAALGAIVLAYLLFTRKSGVPIRLIRSWNTFGVVDFIVAVSIGVLTRENAILASGNSVNSDLMSAFPFALIPAFLVQVFLLTHIIIYLQLRHHWRGRHNVVIP